MEYNGFSVMVLRAIKGKKIVFLVTEYQYFLSHRYPIAIAASKAGYSVTIVTNMDGKKICIDKYGIKYIHVNFVRRSKNIFKEILLIFKILKIYRKEKPNILHHVALKPVLYGSLVSKLININGVVNALTGLGYVFSSNQLLARVLRPCILVAFRFLFTALNSYLIVQNQDDAFFIKKALSKKINITVIQGSGVNLRQFYYTKPPNTQPIILFVSRMLADKGIYELIEAVRLLKKENIDFLTYFIGTIDPHNPSSVQIKELKNWQDSGLIKWLGFRKDIATIWQMGHIAVLPSYREGLPKSLLEAAASGRPIVATDVPGCREIVQHNKNGFLVPPKNVPLLAEALKKLICNNHLREYMGDKSLQLVAPFNVEKVVQQTLAVYASIIKYV